MSDDLISRKALYERIEKSMNENPHSDSNVRQIHNHEHKHFLYVTAQEPTAFDKEKVVEELNGLRAIYFLTIANTGDKKLDCAYDYVGNALDKAIDIVKKGGI